MFPFLWFLFSVELTWVLGLPSRSVARRNRSNRRVRRVRKRLDGRSLARLWSPTRASGQLDLTRVAPGVRGWEVVRDLVEL
jgi:hypothetical protein